MPIYLLGEMTCVYLFVKHSMQSQKFPQKKQKGGESLIWLNQWMSKISSTEERKAIVSLNEATSNNLVYIKWKCGVE
jgi:hypothetical protein